MAKITFKSIYRKKGGERPTFIYTVSGTPEELAAYKKAKEDEAVKKGLAKDAFYREDKDSKNPLYFTQRFVQDECEFKKSEKGEFYPDTTELDKLTALADERGADLACRIQGKQIETAPTN